MKTKKSTREQIWAAAIGGVVVLICDYAGLLPGESIQNIGGVGGMVKAGLFGFLGAVGGLIILDFVRRIRAGKTERGDRS